MIWKKKMTMKIGLTNVVVALHLSFLCKEEGVHQGPLHTYRSLWGTTPL